MYAWDNVVVVVEQMGSRRWVEMMAVGVGMHVCRVEQSECGVGLVFPQMAFEG